MTDSADYINGLTIFKRKRPKTQEQARRHFYCDIVKPGTRCLLSGESCASRHKKAKRKLQTLLASDAAPIDIEIADCTACGTCEFGEMRAELITKRR